MNKRRFLLGVIGFLMAYIFFLALFNLIVPKSDSRLTKKDFLSQKVQTFSYVAVGDSLTEGVGDTTGQGGFIPLLGNNLNATYGYEIDSHNYGVAGNTSNQILNRMKDDKDIKESLEKADLMTLTVGGNDVMAVIRKNLADLDVDTFKKPSKDYQKRLREIIELARENNKNLPIYILGIYNPFYLNFPEVTEMQTVVENWNKATQKVTNEYRNVYFVPINDLLYKGINGEEGIVQTSGKQTTVINDALFADDLFHPNNTGYQLMAEAVTEEIRDTKKKWK
ncbi:SGNH/GDSL hydrolase family protein [Streptococcus sp. S784/96/1]|uniref:SGNH/GDSL hydrolase family protein n=1 Tax=Streptococcus sp. S784/96/1 TaxID=2653499 RepID=UPI0013869F6E|nr:SGNH/GDSL hydrolase family protein [Streptococcus sp. S784/96/1]